MSILAGTAFRLLATAFILFALWYLGFFELLLIFAVVNLVFAVTGFFRRARAGRHDGWSFLTAGALDWFGIVLGTALTGLFLWILMFVGSARADAATQMFWLKVLIVGFSVMVIGCVYQAFLVVTRWNDDRIEQHRMGFSSRAIRFDDIVGVTQSPHGMKIESADGGHIEFAMYHNGAEELARTLERRFGGSGSPAQSLGRS